MQHSNPRWLFHLSTLVSVEENLLAILNGPALKYAAFAAALAMRIPALTGIPGIDIVYSCLVVMGVDVQYIAAIRRAAESTVWWGRVLWSLVALALFAPVFQTNAVFILHAQTGIPELDAMALLHLTPTAWALECAVLLGILMGVSALSRPRHALQPVEKSQPVGPSGPPPGKKPQPDSKNRRDIGRTPEQTAALKRKHAPAVLRLTSQGKSLRQITDALDGKLSYNMVRDIVRESRIAADDLAAARSRTKGVA